MKSLIELYKSHQGKISDKWEIYLREYDRLFTSYRDKTISLLEIGVQNGGSLEIWSKYFKNGKKFIGCDINEKCADLTFNDKRIDLVIGDANISNVQNKVISHSKSYNLIIDDGSHSSGDIIKSFIFYFPILYYDGLFVIEDLHCSYWHEYEGGLFYPFSALEFFKRLADIINYEHWGVEKKRSDLIKSFTSHYEIEITEGVLEQIHSIEFINSICVIRKAHKNNNNLGNRLIVGKDFLVDSSITKSREPKSFVQVNNFWSSLDASPMDLYQKNTKDLLAKEQEIAAKEQEIAAKEQEIAAKEQEIAAKEQEIAAKEQEIAAKEQEISALRNSFSWKITKPYRFFSKRIKLFLIFFKGLISNIIEINKLLKKIVGIYKSFGLKALIFRALNYLNKGHTDQDLYQKYIKEIELNDFHKNATDTLNKFNFYPKFSILIPVYNVDKRWLIKCIDSVINQTYENWQLCLADDNSSHTHIKPLLLEYAKKDKRIQVVFRDSNGHISEATNSALEFANGDYICLMDHDDEIAHNALFEFALLLNKDPTIDMIYSDEDKIDLYGNRYEPFFKPSWSPEALEGCMYTAHFACYRKKIVDTIGGFRSECNGAQDYDFVLRFTEHAKKIEHVPKILYHWRAIPGSTAQSMTNKDYVINSALIALKDRAVRLYGKGSANETLYRGSFELRYPVQNSPLVSFIIPTAGNAKIIKNKKNYLILNLIKSIITKSTYVNYEFVIIHNNDLHPTILKELGKLDVDIKLTAYTKKFNIASKINQGAKLANGEYLLIINDDVEVISKDWIQNMLQHAQKNDVGAVGAKLLYENGTIQHVGVAINEDFLPDHILSKASGDTPGYFFSAVTNRNYLAVTGAVLMVRKKLFDKVKGFSEFFPINYNDIDFCLQLHKLNKRNVFVANAKLYHFESVSREANVSDEEIKLFLKRWKKYLKNISRDPYYSHYLETKPPNYRIKV